MLRQYSREVIAARVHALTLIIALLFLITSAACKQSGVENNSNTNSSSDAANVPSTTPPFSTKEPERYQWTSVTSVSLGDQATPAGAQGAQTNTTQVFIARDGDLRREDYELTPGTKVSFLQLPTGRYRLLHSKKLYAELGDGERAGGVPPPTQTQQAPPDFSPDKLNASRTEARYEKLGAEEVNGRMTTKYRVMIKGAAGETQEAAAVENLIWVDESFGVPVKTETTSSNGARYTMELRDIKLEVDASLFALPSDYKRVESKEIDTEMLSTYLLGGDADENDTKAKGK
jgi:hypothetical protein